MTPGAKLTEALKLLREHEAEFYVLTAERPSDEVARRVFATFTQRERQVARLFVQVNTCVDDIAAYLGIESSTVAQRHLVSIRKKAGRQPDCTRLAVWLLRTPGMAELLDEVEL